MVNKLFSHIILFFLIISLGFSSSEFEISCLDLRGNTIQTGSITEYYSNMDNYLMKATNENNNDKETFIPSFNFVSALGAGTTVTFEGFTTTNYSGNLGGFPSANAKCGEVYAGSHICSYEELFNSNTNESMEIAWIHNGFDNLGSACNYLSDNSTLTPVNVSVDVGTTGGTGQYLDMTLGNDSLPLIAHQEDASNYLKVVKCFDMQCSSSAETSVGANLYPQDINIVLGSDDLPVISYWYASGAQDLRLYKCNDGYCSSGTIRYLGNYRGQYNDIAIGSDGYPVVSMYNHTPYQDLALYKCDNVECSSGTSYLLESTGSVGHHNSIAIGSDTYPIISYYDSSNGDLEIYKCSNVACSSGSSTVLDSTGDVGLYTSITIGSDNYPVIAYYDNTNGNLKLYKCSNVACSSGSARTLDDQGNVGHTAIDIKINPGGYPVISYRDVSNAAVKLYECDNVACSSGTATLIDTGGASSGTYNSVVVDSSGNNYIALYQGNGNLEYIYFEGVKGYSINEYAALNSQTLCTSSKPIACCS